ncbi:hypothetical protein AB0N38_11755 [Micromonospora aurantiaca]|uniref:hypothetical protein n=2 Tax=Micromonospora TaxID=1873 RepID=UPI0001C45CB9|nr:MULTISPECIES: hypothetical protein [Micromonospora]ADU05819.1 hypothetical protein ML5_0266 [Micromonospora sp. L5]UFN94853.1 hypothetical protein LF814_01375 [Micromonospora aurantiaca]SCL38792.1 hypothetical protein GA0070615_3827 [Micromonospora aurantiaca]
MMIVIFDADREWYIQGRVYADIVRAVPAGMLQDDDLDMYLWPARSMSLLRLPRLEPDRAERIAAALTEGVARCLRTIDPSDTELVEFYEGLLDVAARHG